MAFYRPGKPRGKNPSGSGFLHPLVCHSEFHGFAVGKEGALNLVDRPMRTARPRRVHPLTAKQAGELNCGPCRTCQGFPLVLQSFDSGAYLAWCLRCRARVFVVGETKQGVIEAWNLAHKDAPPEPEIVYL